MIFLQMFEFISIYIEQFIGIVVILAALSNQNIRWKQTVVGVFVSSCSIWLLNQISLFSVSVSLIAFLIMVILVCGIYKIWVWDAILASVFYWILLYIVDFLVLSIAGLILGEEQIIRFIVDGMSWKRVGFMGISKSILIFTSWILATKILTNISLLIRKLWIALLVFSVIVIYFAKSSFSEITIDIMWSWLFMLLFFVLAVYTIVQYMRYTKDKERLTLSLERNRFQLENYNEMIRLYQARQVFFYDLKNQYVIIENYLKTKQYAEAEQYIEELRKTRYERPNKQYIGNLPVDILLDYKVKEAERKKIHVDIQSEQIDVPLSDQELTSLLGNAFDNAIEACEKMQSGVKWIRMTIQRKQNMVFMKISNSYEHKPLKLSGRFFTTKDQEQIHGLGIMSMQMIIDKYDGVMDVSAADGEFVVSISIFDE